MTQIALETKIAKKIPLKLFLSRPIKMAHEVFIFSISPFKWHWNHPGWDYQENFKCLMFSAADLWTDNLKSLESKANWKDSFSRVTCIKSECRTIQGHDVPNNTAASSRKEKFLLWSVISKWKIAIVSSEFCTFSNFFLIKSTFVYASPKILSLAAMETQYSWLTFSNRVPLNHTDSFISIRCEVFTRKSFLTLVFNSSTNLKAISSGQSSENVKVIEKRRKMSILLLFLCLVLWNARRWWLLM